MTYQGPRVFLFSIFFIVLSTSGCSKEDHPNSEDAGDDEPGQPPRDGVDIPDTREDILPDALDTAEESDLPYGYYLPRCGTSFVETCADCPGMPFACEPCNADSRCVADCETECNPGHGHTNCADNGTCVQNVPCTPHIFCGCAGPLKACTTEDDAFCVESCAAQCPGKQHNCHGTCGTGETSACCFDDDGPEYFCWYSGEGCASSCESCEGGQCPFYDTEPDPSYLSCRPDRCCEEGVLCPLTSACVSSCQECGEQYAGTCGTRGMCVTDCDDCRYPVSTTPGHVLGAVCSSDGTCVDLMSDCDHCGACNNPCTESDEYGLTYCSHGHCCPAEIAIGEGRIDTFWCDACNCCLNGAGICVPDYPAGCSDCFF